VLVTTLIAMGILGPSEGKLATTNYRSAVGAQEPRKTVSLDGLSRDRILDLLPRDAGAQYARILSASTS